MKLFFWNRISFCIRTGWANPSLSHQSLSLTMNNPYRSLVNRYRQLKLLHKNCIIQAYLYEPFTLKCSKNKLLVSVAETHSNIKIKLQCAWVLSIFSKTHYCHNEIPPDYHLIVQLLCKIMMVNLLTFKPLFYLCCWAL